jgi:hypothetical protein
LTVQPSQREAVLSIPQRARALAQRLEHDHGGDALAGSCAHYAIRALLHDTGDHNDIDPGRLSFTRGLRAARRSVRVGVGTTKSAVSAATALAHDEIMREIVPVRFRAAARVIKRKR